MFHGLSGINKVGQRVGQRSGLVCELALAATMPHPELDKGRISAAEANFPSHLSEISR